MAFLSRVFGTANNHTFSGLHLRKTFADLLGTLCGTRVKNGVCNRACGRGDCSDPIREARIDALTQSLLNNAYLQLIADADEAGYSAFKVDLRNAVLKLLNSPKFDRR